MEIEEYRIMYNLEDTHWRYVGMRRIYFNLLDRFYKRQERFTILDAGCGTGILLEKLKRYGSPIGVDISEDALYFSRLRGHGKLLRASVTALPFTDRVFDIIASIEVIYHRQVKRDLEALEEFHRVLKKGGRLILCVPAYDFLKSEHDEAVHTRHRYTKNELKMKMQRAGFKVERITYINAFLFPLIALLRLMRRIHRRTNRPRSDLKPTSALLRKVLVFILTIEAQLVKIVNFPFGLSVLCISRK